MRMLSQDKRFTLVPTTNESGGTHGMMAGMTIPQWLSKPGGHQEGGSMEFLPRDSISGYRYHNARDKIQYYGSSLPLPAEKTRCSLYFV